MDEELSRVDLDENDLETNFILTILDKERVKVKDLQDQLDTLRATLTPKTWTQGAPTVDMIRTHESRGANWLVNDPLFHGHPCIIRLKTDEFNKTWVINSLIDIPERFDLCDWANRCKYLQVNHEGIS